MTFLIPALGAANRTFDQLTTLRRILSSTSRAAVLPQRTSKTLRLRDALITVDGRTAGVTYYDIAIMLYGREYVVRNRETGLTHRILLLGGALPGVLAA